MKKLINRTYIFPWLIILVFGLLVLSILALVYDSDTMSRIWPIVAFGGIIAAVCCTAFDYFIFRSIHFLWIDQKNNSLYEQR